MKLYNQSDFSIRFTTNILNTQTTLVIHFSLITIGLSSGTDLFHHLSDANRAFSLQCKLTQLEYRAADKDESVLETLE